MDQLVPAVRHYSWGSRSLIPQLLGQPESSQPVAELWYGAHPAAPSQLGGQRDAHGASMGLDAYLQQHPQQLGPHAETGLPFLLKLLAADEVLSLQAHPSMEQAREGFARENSLGIDLDAASRNYKDASHKPELIVALTPFYAMAGFRPLAQTLELFAALGSPELDRYLGMVSTDDEEASLQALFTTWITIPAAARRELISSVVDAAPRVPSGWMSQVMDTVLEIHQQYPGDIGVLGALLLNHVQLQPGEAVFLAAGQLHAYVRGLGVEVMANSDNVLRGGLTSKNVDVPELVKVLSFGALAQPQVHAQQAADTPAGVEAWEYPVPVEEFNVTRYECSPGAQGELLATGPAIALCTSGELQIGQLRLNPGDAAWIPADTPAPHFTTPTGAQFFLAYA
ncbi:mannose-6-phosphate isomerase, class I [Corynebacterium lizhenjunii]|uniref:mannose-6-phosphate isomerase, class I n=1 Tax=Corynebacterium lizhenjunii TaxID=2709394 RepID=UPI0013ED4563|nr:mannose-6-phosphate isomerase, class I [Corynebacterium lizhenjunii]